MNRMKPNFILNLVWFYLNKIWKSEKFKIYRKNQFGKEFSLIPSTYFWFYDGKENKISIRTFKIVAEFSLLTMTIVFSKWELVENQDLISIEITEEANLNASEKNTKPKKMKPNRSFDSSAYYDVCNTRPRRSTTNLRQRNPKIPYFPKRTETHESERNRRTSSYPRPFSSYYIFFGEVSYRMPVIQANSWIFNCFTDVTKQQRRCLTVLFRVGVPRNTSSTRSKGSKKIWLLSIAATITRNAPNKNAPQNRK